jgi:hypothetical protein
MASPLSLPRRPKSCADQERGFSVWQVLFVAIAAIAYLDYIGWGDGDQLDIIDLHSMVTAEAYGSFLIWDPADADPGRAWWDFVR